MNKTLVATLFAAAVFGGIAHAEEGGKCGSIPQDKWMTKDALKAKASELGYDVRQVKVENGCYEVYGIKDGKKVEVIFNPETGAQVGADGDD
ncbi:PepSY domain-containing protein [Rhizobium sp. S95]|uniref:PepSY domain-containing protein n=1 Tax=Ciceribacter sichuanensis TaxID=2949647 RepID=A0AAJ1BWA9_9HYPH|nr:MULTISPECIES: PepSY domain-containing protein [unclassified Ciceribacter]MCM2398762.1 PepSY domain-containing protein [Ciceribacter sp. S95]MCO5957032.1 PepSY domain-containing protein [Ciceribacter sp. S101]